MNLRKIALVNGSVTGKTSLVNGSASGTYGTNSYQTLNIRGFTNICFIWCWDVLVASFETYTMPAYGSDQNIARYKHLFTDRHTHAPNNDSRGNADILPGGWFPGYETLDESIMAQSQGFDGTLGFQLELSQKDVFLEQRTNSGVHCFIPSFSALGMKNPNQNWAQSLKRNLVCNSEIPFDSYFGHDDNTRHTSFDCESVNWLLKELDGIPQAPWFPLQSSDLGGPTTPLCINSTATYSFASLCSIPSGAIWSVSSNLQNMSSSNTSITVKGISNGTGTITAIFSNGYQVVKSINVGGPIVNITYSMNGSCNNGYQTWSLNASSPNSVSSWLWTKDASANGSWYIYNPSSASTFVDVSGGGGISVTAANSCGTTKTGVTIYSNCPHFKITATPNPTTNNVTITLAESKEVTASKKKSLIYQVKVTDELGNIKKQYKYFAGVSNTSISLSGLVSGLYTIQAFDGAVWSSTKVIKQ